MLPRLKVLFLCTRNSCRSQMAEGWARALHADRIDAYSAGTTPGSIDPRAVQVMREAGIELTAQRSKSIDELTGLEFDLVVSVCDRAKEACPTFPGALHRMHVSFDDPPRLAAEAVTEEERLSHYRRVRDEIGAFVRTLPAVLADVRPSRPGAPR